MILIIDYQMGNVTSVQNAFRALGADAVISQNLEDIEAASHLLLPGVGSFGEGMLNLNRLGLINVLKAQVLDKKKPLLGICLGMQLLADKGHEFGEHDGLGWVPGSVKRLETKDLPLPHVGWNNLIKKNNSPLLDKIPAEADFYFVHSYYFSPTDANDCAAICDYGQEFSAVIQRGNIYGAQFHPEKSQKAGKLLLSNFLNCK